jgi:DNA polymerase III subunit gamma/tau
MSQALYRKWRPHLWNEVIGQDHVVQTLRNAVASGRVAHAYLFAGPRGTGKTTTARLLAKAVNCLAPQAADRPCDQCEHCQSVNDGRFLDLIEIDAASNTSVEDVRDLRDKINFSPSQGEFKVYIIDEVHMLSTAAFNALLKTLEEPPSHAIFILATTEVHKIPATVLSRCQRHEFRRVPVKDIVATLKSIAEKEKLQIEPDALTLIARQSTGSLRDAISLLDQLSSVGGTITLAQAHTVLGTATSQVVIDLVDALLKRQPGAGLDHIHVALDAGSDPRQFARQVVDYLRGLLLIRMGSADQVEATLETRSIMAQQAQGFETAGLLEAIRAFNGAAVDQQRSWQPGLALELAFAKSIEEPVIVPANISIRQSETPGAHPKPARPEAAPAQAQPAVERQPAAENPLKVKPTQAVVTAPAAVPPSPSPAAAQAQTAAAPATVQDGAGGSLQVITQNWAKIRALVKKSKKPQTEALLNSCKPMGIKDGVLLLGFQTELIKSKMETNDNLLIIRQALAQALGFDMQVRCVIASGKGKSLPADLNVETDGMVGTALRDLGGEIVDSE